MDNTIHFILTGGTIDKMYDPVLQGTTMRQESCLPEYIGSFIQPHIDCRFETLFMIDSLRMNNEHRLKIKNAILNSNAKKILISHGTDTMTNTAEYLLENLPKGYDKIIVITGSLIPVIGFSKSDAGFNLGFALGVLIQKSSGIYICMHGRAFEAGSVKKNAQTARFESIN